jgi:hypothetical protein
MIDRLKTAGKTLLTGKMPNPLAQEPRQKGRKELVAEMNEWATETRAFWKPIFDRIKEEQDFAAGHQWPSDYKCKGDEREPFIGDVIQQMLNRKTASLYAKNPTPEAKMAEKMNYAVWDESQESLNGAKAILEAAGPILQQAQQAIMMGQEIPPPPPEIEFAQSIVKDYEAGMAEKAMYDKIARTASLLLDQQWRVQSPEFLASMKQLVTRVLTSRVAFIKVMYRSKGDGKEVAAQSANLPVDDIAALKMRLEAMSEPDFDQDSSEVEETRLLMQSMAQRMAGAQQQPTPDDEPDNEGLVYDFLPATAVLIDRRCRGLRELIAAKRIAHEIVMPYEECERVYGVSLDDTGAVCYEETGKERQPKAKAERSSGDDGDKGQVCVWHIEDKETGLCYVVCDGVKDFLREPYANEPKVARFWSIVPVVLNVQEVEVNEPEKDVTIYPRSDVRLAMPMQQDINNAGEGLREHRVANRPWWIGDAAAWGEKDRKKLASPRQAHEILMVEALAMGKKLDDAIMPGPLQAIDPKLYDPSPSNQAMMLATGMQPSNLGAQRADETATGQSIAEGSRISADASNTDDLDFALSTIAQMSWEMLAQEMPEERVKKLVGRGAVWPRLSMDAIRSEIYLQIEAGSSGKPNAAMELQKLEKALPLLIEVMTQEGKSLVPVIKMLGRAADSNIDVDDLLKPAQIQGPQPVMPAAPGQQGAPGGPLPPGNAAPNVPQPGQAPGAPPLPPASRQQAMQTANG